MIALHIDRIEDAQRHFQTGLAWAEREACPIEVGRNLHGLAQIDLRKNNESAARQKLARAIAIFEKHDSVIFLARAKETSRQITRS